MSKQANKLGSNPLIDSVVKQVIGQTASDSNLDQSKNQIINDLIKKLEELGIKSVTYRFPIEEISEFDKMIMGLQKALGGTRVNKNDVIRTGVSFIVQDWKKNKKESLIFQLLKKWAAK